MTPLTEKHAQLLKSNRALLLTFERLPVAVKLSTVGFVLLLGVGSGITALTGTASNRVQLCIRNKQALQCLDKTGKPYIMTEYYAERWKANPNVVFHKKIPATNPHKALWMALAGCSFWAAGAGLRSLQNSERQLANYEILAEKRDLAKGQLAARTELLEDYRAMRIKEVQAEGDVEAVANDCAVVLKQCEVLGEADIRIAQMEAEEAVFEAETAGLSEDKKQEYIAFLRNQKNPFQLQLTGTQTFDGINNPSDKVESSTAAIIELSSNLEIARKIAARILNSLAGINTSIFLAGPTRTGKTRTLHKWLRDTNTRFPPAEIYVIAQKYEDFPGVPRNRIAIFDPLFPEESMKFLDEVYAKLQSRKSQPATEETYRNRPIKLILEDWFATHQCLVQKRNAQLWEDKASKLGSIATVGGQYNVGYFICTQTFNLASSGVADSNIRLNLALIAQGLVRTTSNDEEQGSYGVIEQLLNNQRVIASKDTRDKLTSDLKQLIPISMAEQTPVILSTIGNPVLGLMPEIELSFGGNQPSFDDVPTVPTSDISEQAGTPLDALGTGSQNPGTPYGTRAERISAMFEALKAGTHQTPVFAPDSPLEHEEKLELAKLVIEQKLGLKKTIWVLWGVTRGGRNHQLFVEARKMLKNLKGISDSEDDLSEDDLDD
ncbi:hypothetical protein QUB19_15535 [Microcoleus sp. B4-C5]|uniref:hypothetical protein n=1 Tax=unclassified Microcoleus TaxID=2642155 RepID=UPI002FD4E67E